MATKRIIPGEIRIFLNHIYEFKKGIRNMVLYTMSKEHEDFAVRRLKNQNISYMIQEIGTNKINLFFGKPECMEAMRHIITRPLNQLTAEKAFILGSLYRAESFLKRQIIGETFSNGNLLYQETIRSTTN